MTIKKFQELFYIAKTKEVDIDKSIKLVGVVTGKTPEQVEALSMVKFNKVCAKIKQKFEIFDKNLLKSKPKNIVLVKGRLYKINYEVGSNPINAGKYVEVVTFAKDVVTNLHKIMASIVTPVRWRMGKLVPYERAHSIIATDFESMNFEAAYHAAVFFYTHYSVSMKLIRPYLMKDMEGKVSREMAEETLNNLYQTLDGFTMPEWSQNLKEYLLNRYGV